MNISRVSGLFFLALFCTYGILATDIPLDFWSEEEIFTARSLPYAIATVGMLISLLLTLLPSTDIDWRRILKLRWIPALQLLLTMSVYGLVFEYLGFLVATTVFLATSFVILGERRPTAILFASLPVVLGFWLLMDSLGIYLSPGEFYLDWFGQS